MSLRKLSTFAALCLCVSAVRAANVPASLQNGLLVDAGGHTLYVYDRDTTPGRSACNGSCAALWPPFAAPSGASPAADFSILERADGSRQWAYKGKPLYRWTGDQKPGDKNGDGVNAIWHLAK